MASKLFEYFSRFSVFYEFLKLYGLSEAIKGIFFYNYRILLRRFSDLSQEIVKVNGYNIKIIPRDKGISEELLMFKTHEPLSTKLISRELKSGMVCLEAGANIGYYTLLESKLVGDNGKIIAIEPSPENYKMLLENIKLENLSNVETYNFACGEKNGTVKFLVSEKSNRCTTVSNNYIPSELEKLIDVPLKQLDQFLEELSIDKLDFLRMDVEGYEYYILKGLKKTLEKFKPMIQIEIHSKFMPLQNTKEILSDLKKSGYDVLYYTARDLDMPMIGTMNNVKQYPLDTIISLLEKNKLPGIFSLFLKNNT